MENVAPPMTDNTLVQRFWSDAESLSLSEQDLGQQRDPACGNFSYNVKYENNWTETTKPLFFYFRLCIWAQISLFFCDSGDF